jgi:hypothetical protein
MQRLARSEYLDVPNGSHFLFLSPRVAPERNIARVLGDWPPKAFHRVTGRDNAMMLGPKPPGAKLGSNSAI